ncbi:MAG: hypothetical protein EPO27_12145 [Betaproteobacteria bacterium]|nr:MAG: hypothetical protein EPO27_12145 [Betaproteobacteria bacterium]
MAIRRFRLLTCFLPAGRALAVLERLRKEHDLTSLLYHHARGVGVGSQRGWRSYVAAEREVISVLAPEARADELFRFLFFAAGLDEPNSGMVLMERVLRASPFELPEIPAAPEAQA